MSTNKTGVQEGLINSPTAGFGYALRGLRLIARPDFSIINYTADDVDIFEVAETMAASGWLPGLTRRPKGMHAMLSLLHEDAREPFLADLSTALDHVREQGRGTATIEAVY